MISYWVKKNAKLTLSAGQRRQIKTITPMDDMHVSNFDFFQLPVYIWKLCSS